MPHRPAGHAVLFAAHSDIDYCEQNQVDAEAEKLALMLGKPAIAVPIALAIGSSGRSDRKALLDNWKKRRAANKLIAMPTFKQRNPIDAATFSRFVLALPAKPNCEQVIKRCFDGAAEGEIPA